MTGLAETELLAMLAEEAAELGHAALKLRRALDGSNPTPVTENQARAGLQEEIDDVFVCLMELGIDWSQEGVTKKAARWMRRLKKDPVM